MDEETKIAKRLTTTRMVVPGILLLLAGSSCSFDAHNTIERIDLLEATGTTATADIEDIHAPVARLATIFGQGYNFKVDLAWNDESGAPRSTGKLGIISRVAEEFMYDGELFSRKIPIRYSEADATIRPIPALHIEEQTSNSQMRRTGGLVFAGLGGLLLLAGLFMLSRRKISF